MGEIKTCPYCGGWLLSEDFRVECAMEDCNNNGCVKCIPNPPRFCIDCVEDVALRKRKEEGTAKP